MITNQVKKIEWIYKQGKDLIVKIDTVIRIICES